MTVKVLTIQHTVQAALYATGDALGPKITFTDAVEPGRPAIIRSLALVDMANVKPQFELLLFHSDFTGIADNAAMDISDLDLRKFIGFIQVVTANWISLVDNAVGIVYVNLPIQPPSSNLYGQIVTRSGVTFIATDDVMLLLGIEQF